MGHTGPNLYRGLRTSDSERDRENRSCTDEVRTAEISGEIIIDGREVQNKSPQ